MLAKNARWQLFKRSIISGWFVRGHYYSGKEEFVKTAGALIFYQELATAVINLPVLLPPV
jgi:hypothetical protein